MKQMKFFAALCCVAAAFAACDPAPEQFYVMVAANDEVMGTVQVNGTSSYFASYYSAGAQINIMATPNTGCYFQQWDDGNTDNPRTITVTANAAYTAIFAANPNGNESGHEYVDLGLPSGLKWATCNVGATAPEAYGDYYAWGETTPKDYYAWSTYKWATATYDEGFCTTIIKYNTNDYYGTVDNKRVLDPEDDAAHVNWGGQWRMPTDAEWQELHENCTWEWTDDYNGTGVAGRIVFGSNGNSIFLPAAGYRYRDDLGRAGDDGYYWSSSLLTDDPADAWCVSFDWGRYYRYYGHSVRAVFK